jgi:CheY-like chemotaxis protein
MSADQPRRRDTDRRRASRGGRRAEDRSGFTPLVLVVEEDPAQSEVSEAILAKLRFAVTPVDSVEKALSIMRALRPDIIIAGAHAVDQLRDSVPSTKEGRSIPVIAAPVPASPEQLVHAIRRALSVAETV